MNQKDLPSCSTPTPRRSPRISAREEFIIELKNAVMEMMYPALRGFNLTLEFQKNLFMDLNKHFKVKGDKNLFGNDWQRQFRKEIQEKTGETFESGPEVKTVYVIITDSDPKMLVYLILLKEGGFKTSFTVYKEVCLKFLQEEELLEPNDLKMRLTEGTSGCENQPSTSKQMKVDDQQRLKVRNQSNRKGKQSHMGSQTEKMSQPSVQKAKKRKIDNRLNTEPESSTPIVLSESSNNAVSVCTATKDSSVPSPSGDATSMDTESRCGLSPEDFNPLVDDTFSIDEFTKYLEQEIINGDVAKNFESNLNLEAENEFFPDTFVSQIKDVLAVTVGTQTDDTEPYVPEKQKEMQEFVEDSQEKSSPSAAVNKNSMVMVVYQSPYDTETIEIQNSMQVESYNTAKDGPETPLNLSVKSRDDICMWDMFPLGQRQLTHVERTSCLMYPDM